MTALWLGLSVGAAGVFHRLRRRRTVAIPAEVTAFMRALDGALGCRADAGFVVKGMLRGRFVLVLAREGQEALLPLQPLFSLYRENPADLPDALDAALGELASDRPASVTDHEFAQVVGSILPQVRSDAWLRGKAPAFGDGALVTRPLSEGVRICYVIDAPESMVFVTHAHLRAWQVDEATLFRTARANLARRAGAKVPIPRSGEDSVLLQVGDGYDAARILLLDPEQAEGLLVAIPERDALWLGTAARADLAALMRSNRAQNETALHPVSPTIYRVRDGALEPVTDATAV